MKSRLILEIGERTIKACRAKLLKKKRVINFLEVKDFSNNLTLEDIEKVFSKLFKIKYNNIIVSLPRPLFLIRFLKLPSQDIQEIRNMLPFQLLKVVPHPLDEIIYDFSIVKSEEGFSHIIIFIIPKEKVEYLLEFIKRAKVDFSAITITSEGLGRWLTFQENFFKEEIQYPAILIDIDKYYIDFLILNKEGIIFSRSFTYLGDEQLLGGINQSLTVFEKEFGKHKFNKVIFTGIRKEKVLERVSLGKSIFINYRENFSLEKALKEKIPDNFSFASILGISQDIDLPTLDFSPEFLRRNRESLRKRRRYVEISLVGLEIVLIFSIFLFKYIFDRYAYLNLLNSKLKKMKVEAKELDKVSRRLEIIDKELLKEPTFSQMIYVLTSFLPSTVQITLLDFQENGEFSLKGYADDISTVFEIVKYLNDSGPFKEVKIKYASQVKRENRVVVDFYIHGKRNL